MDNPRRRRSRVLPAAAVVAGTALLSGCSAEQVGRGFLPGYADGEVTNMTERVTTLWTGSWVAALAVGLVVWGLVLWCVTVYRKRKDDDVLPVQLRYHVPLEVMYIVLPILMIGVMFIYTARDIDAISALEEDPDVVIEVYGKQWSWDFNYLDEDVHIAGIQAQYGPDGFIDGQNVPTLVLPVGKSVQIDLEARDVIHSFWVVDFLYKKDLIPGKSNVMYFTPTKEGSYLGKCAELCGVDHSRMLFNVKVVSPERYEQHLKDLVEKGQTGYVPAGIDQTEHEKNREANIL